MPDFCPDIQRQIDLLADPELTGFVSEYLRDHRRPALRADELWDEKRHLKVGLLARLFGRRKQPPVLAQHASKYGGVPYLEDPKEWPRTRQGEQATFVGQLNFSEVNGPAGFPRQGIFVVFLVHSDEEFFRVRWYPQAEPGRAARLDWPVPSVDVEVPLHLCSADSFCIPGLWEEIIPEPIAARQRYEVDEMLAGIREAVGQYGGNVGAEVGFGLDGPGPRQWLHDELYEVDRWYQLWTPLDGWWGSMSYSLMIRPQDFDAGRLERCETLGWQ